MKHLTRPLSALFLALLLALTGQSMAVARGATSPTGEMVLCIGGGPVVVPVDAEGNPVSAPQYCPDCVMSLLEAIAPAFDMPAQDFGKGQRLGIASLKSLVGSDCPSPQARGPPVSV